MAKTDKVATPVAKATDAKATTATEKKPMVKRSKEDLVKTGEKGILILIARGAMGLANEKNREGLDSIVVEEFVEDEKGNLTKEKKTKEAMAKEGAKQLAGRMNLILRAGGKLELMDEKDENYLKLKAAAQKALPDLKKKSYSANVKAFLNFCIESLSTGSGKRGFNPGSLMDIEL